MSSFVSRRRFLIMGVSAAALAACSSQGGASAPAAAGPSSGSAAAQPARTTGRGKDTTALVVGPTSGGITNDPAQIPAIEDWTTWQQLYNGLLRYKPGGFELQADLAESWDISKDGKKYTFTLRPGVQFHRGFGELTSQDVKFSFDRNNDPVVKSTNRGFLKMLDRVDAPDKYTVVFTLKQPYAPFMSLVALGRPGTGAIISKAAADKLGNANYTEHPIGSGPFVYESEIPNQSRMLSRNEQYYEGPAYAKSLTLTNMADETTLSQAVEKGEVHIGSAGSADTFAKYKNSAAAQFLIDPSFNMTGVFLNVTKPPFDRVEVRQALAYCVNQKELIEGALAGVATQANAGLLTPGMLGYDDSIKPPAFDPAKAKDLLASAGVTNLKMTWPVYTGSVWNSVGALLKEQFRQAGIDLSVLAIEHATLNQRRSEKTNDGTIFSNTTNPEPESMLRYLTSAQLPPGANWSWYTGIDALIDQSEQSVDKDDRAAIVKRAQAQLAKDMPMLPMFHQQRTVLAAKNLRGYQADPLGGFWLREVWLA